MTVEVSLFSIILSFIIGGLIGILRFARIRYFSHLLGILVDIIRNLPLLLIIFFFYFALPQIGIRFSIIGSSIVSMTFFESCMLSEIFRAGLEAVPKGQMEAGLSTGLSYVQTMYYIIFPQAYKSMLPAILSQLISLIKDTSLAVIISLPDITHNAKLIYGQHLDYIFPMFVMMTILYFIVCYMLSLLSRFLEKRKYKY